VVVTGGTGFVGRALCHSLVARGDDVVVLTRGPARDLTHACGKCGSGGKVALTSWTPDSPGPWMSIVDGADAIVHLAGADVTEKRWTPERKELLRSSRIVGAALLADAIVQARKRPRVFLSMSGIGHYGTSTGDAIVDETSPAGDDFLATLTKDWEAAAAKAAGVGVRVVHPRMGVVLGHGGGAYDKLAPIFKAFVGGPVGDGTQYFPWVHLRDTVRALEAMLDRADFEGVFNLVAPEPVTMNTFASELAACLGRPCLMRVPPAAVKMMLGAEAATTFLTGQRAMPKRLVDAGFAFVFPDLSSALADLARSGGDSA
jgi:uncharacterized protein (TIGR01777 family)